MKWVNGWVQVDVGLAMVAGVGAGVGGGVGAGVGLCIIMVSTTKPIFVQLINTSSFNYYSISINRALGWVQVGVGVAMGAGVGAGVGACDYLPLLLYKYLGTT